MNTFGIWRKICLSLAISICFPSTSNVLGSPCFSYRKVSCGLKGDPDILVLNYMLKSVDRILNEPASLNDITYEEVKGYIANNDFRCGMSFLIEEQGSSSNVSLKVSLLTSVFGKQTDLSIKVSTFTFWDLEACHEFGNKHLKIFLKCHYSSRIRNSSYINAYTIKTPYNYEFSSWFLSCGSSITLIKAIKLLLGVGCDLGNNSIRFKKQSNQKNHLLQNIVVIPKERTFCIYAETHIKSRSTERFFYGISFYIFKTFSFERHNMARGSFSLDINETILSTSLVFGYEN